MISSFSEREEWGISLIVPVFQDYRTQVKFNLVSINTKIDKKIKAVELSPEVNL